MEKFVMEKNRKCVELWLLFKRQKCGISSNNNLTGKKLKVEKQFKFFMETRSIEVENWKHHYLQRKNFKRY